MLIKYLEGLKPLKITAWQKKFSFSYDTHAKAKSDIKLKLTDRRENDNDTNWIEEKCCSLQKGKHCSTIDMSILEDND